MERIGWALIWGGVFALVLWLMWRGWRARSRRSAAVLLEGPPPGLGDPRFGVAGEYVATTFAGRQFDRAAPPGLAFRGRAFLVVHPAGLTLTVLGGEPMFIAAHRLRGVGLGNWTIDRVVEQDGMAVITWEHSVQQYDSWFRPESPADGARLVEALSPLVRSADALFGEEPPQQNPTTEIEEERP